MDKKIEVIGTGVLDITDIDKLKEFPKEYGIQRMTNRANISRIKNSMSELYIPSVIKVNQDWYILDGQHSKEAIKELAEFDYSSVKYVPIEYYEKMKRGKFDRNAILLYKDGAYIGKTTIFRKDLIEQIKNQKGLHPDFMKYLVDSIKINQIVLV